MTSTEKKVGDGTSVEVFVATAAGVEGAEPYEVTRRNDGTNVSVVTEHALSESTQPASAATGTVSVATPDPHRRTYLGQNEGFTLVHGAAIRLGNFANSSDSVIDWGSVIDLAGGKTDPDYIVNNVVQGALVGEFTDESDVVRQVYMERHTERFYYYKDDDVHTREMQMAQPQEAKG